MWFKKNWFKFAVLIGFVFLAASCNKPVVKNEPKPIVENSIVATSTPATTTPEVLGANTTTPTDIPKPAQVKTIIKTIDNSEALKQAQQEAENARVAQQQAEQKAATLQAQQKAIQDTLDAAATQKAQQDQIIKQQAAAQAAAEAQALQQQIAQKQAKLQAIELKSQQLKTECTDPINSLKQQAIDVKTKYFADLDQLNHQPQITSAYYNSMSTQLLNDTNTKIQDFNNQISQIQLQCSVKFGN